MKHLFAVILLILIATSAAIWASLPGTQSDVPVIYWVTDPNPARELQVETFHDWLRKSGYVDEDGEPIVELRIDTANRDQSKQIIQSVSGVGSDIMDVGPAPMRLFHEMSIIRDLTEPAKELSFSPKQTYKALEPVITVDGRQYMFPCNVAVVGIWVNKDVFADVGMDPPPQRWTLEQFEAMGKQFAERANPPGTRPNEQRFFCNNLNEIILHRGMGLSQFNETLTASDLNDERYAKVLQKKYQWIYVDNFMPTPDDTDAMVVGQGYGGVTLGAFGQGNYAMVAGGRYFLIRFREYRELGQMAVVEPPHGGYPNTTISTRAAVVYEGADHPKLAYLFLSYLASEDYNSLIVKDADALPPNPAYTRDDRFLKPADHPNEWGTHEQFVRLAEEIAVGEVFSPFILGSVVARHVRYYQEQYYNRIDNVSAEEAARRTAEAIDQDIADELRRKPYLRQEYDRRIEIQKKIDQRLAAGEKIPAEWVFNPFYQRYYADIGLLEMPETDGDAATETAP